MATVSIRVDDAGKSEDIEIVSLEVAPGTAVLEGDMLAEVATDKANVEVTSPAAGVVGRVFVAEGDTVSPDTVLLEIETED